MYTLTAQQYSTTKDDIHKLQYSSNLAQKLVQQKSSLFWYYIFEDDLHNQHFSTIINILTAKLGQYKSPLLKLLFLPLPPSCGNNHAD
jgi:hypothetical protein